MGSDSAVHPLDMGAELGVGGIVGQHLAAIAEGEAHHGLIGVEGQRDRDPRPVIDRGGYVRSDLHDSSWSVPGIVAERSCV